MYRYAEPVDKQCEKCQNSSEGFSRIGLWKTEDSNADPDSYCLNCVLEIDPEIENFQELVFEGNVVSIDEHAENVSITVENSFGTTVHRFPVKDEKFERFTKGNPNSASPGHGGFYYQRKLNTKKAEVEIISPRRELLDGKFGYWYKYVDNQWEGEIRDA